MASVALGSRPEEPGEALGGGGSGAEGPSSSSLLIPPTKVRVGGEDGGGGGKEIEIALHVPTRSMAREIAMFFQGRPPLQHPVFVITTCQESQVDLTEWSLRANEEKDRLLDCFVKWASAVCSEFEELGFWADYFDPCSGLLKEGTARWSEVHAMQVLRGHRVHQAGPCHISLHPVYGSRVYPCSMLVSAPRQVVVNVLQRKIT